MTTSELEITYLLTDTLLPEKGLTSQFLMKTIEDIKFKLFYSNLFETKKVDVLGLKAVRPELLSDNLCIVK